MKLLVAEDDSVSRLLLVRLLELWGYDVLAVANGIDAWKLLCRAGAPPLALLDWMMPGLDGVEICRRVRQRGGDDRIYIILLTALETGEHLVEGLEAGADDYLAKPFKKDELRARIHVGERLIEAHAQVVALKNELREQAMHDALTGLLNRRAVMRRLAEEVARAARRDAPLSVAMIDLDRFKRINDAHGHGAGDVVLRETARRIQAALRSYDVVGRYGGEEFLVLLPGATRETAAHICERLRAALASQRLRVGDDEIPVTLSVGVASLAGGVSTDELVNAADGALYRAKAAGRNRVAHAGVDASSPRAGDSAAPRARAGRGARRHGGHDARACP